MRALKSLVATGIMLASLATAAWAPAQTAPQTELQKKIEQYLRHIYAFGPEVKLVVPEPKDSEVAGLLVTTVELTSGESHDTAKMYISKDGKFLFRGDVSDLSKDPMAETRAKIDLKSAPFVGSETSTVTVVEFADFECPVCRQLHDQLKTVLPNYPQVKFYFKDYPIEQIHPWAKTAALAGHCAFNQKPAAFWKIYDGFYDSQDLVSAANAWDKAVDFAGQAGLDQAAFKTCLASPEAAAAVEASVANARALDVTSTPTIFVNGRRVVGADTATIERFIQYEIGRQKPSARAGNN
ncbi:MAG: thioredoxin domain-containing protein [Acidobacteria bacterium]|nr:thioredoxin domain-containing protein [Acidobacteriota bacterium]MBS1865907.1 thioredoxin domain-containing protein [Acidobacteriota bacterium]